MNSLNPKVRQVIGACLLFAGGFLAGFSIDRSVVPIPPGPGPAPAPDVNPIPIESDDLVVLFVEQTEDRSKIHSDQLQVLTSVQVRKWLDEHKAKYRFWDLDVQVSDKEDAFWKEILKVPRDSVPWVYVSNGKKGYSGPVSNIAETIAMFEEMVE